MKKRAKMVGLAVAICTLSTAVVADYYYDCWVTIKEPCVHKGKQCRVLWGGVYYTGNVKYDGATIEHCAPGCPGNASCTDTNIYKCTFVCVIQTSEGKQEVWTSRNVPYGPELAGETCDCN